MNRCRTNSNRRRSNSMQAQRGVGRVGERTTDCPEFLLLHMSPYSEDNNAQFLRLNNGEFINNGGDLEDKRAVKQEKKGELCRG